MLVTWTRARFRAWWPPGGTGESLPQHVFEVGAVRKVIVARTVVFRRQALLPAVARPGYNSNCFLRALLRRFSYVTMHHLRR